jgi:hypothetical protein
LAQLAISLVNFLGGLVAAACSCVGLDREPSGAWRRPTRWLVANGVLLLLPTTGATASSVAAHWRLHRLHHTDRESTSRRRCASVGQLLRPLFVVGAISAAAALWSIRSSPCRLLCSSMPMRVARARSGAGVAVFACDAPHHSRRRVEDRQRHATGLTRRTFSASASPHGIGLDGFDLPAQQTLRGMLHNPWEGTTARP